MKNINVKRTGWIILLAGAVLIGAVPFVVAGQDAYSVWMDRVEGEWTGTQAELVWTTEMEAGATGFRVSQVKDGLDVPLHEGFIPVDMSRPEGGSYRLAVPGQTINSTASFRLEELRRDGTIHPIGEWTVCFKEKELAPMAMVAMAEPLEDEPAAAGLPLTTGPALKVPVLSNGLYSVSFADIAAVLGWTAVAETNLAMRCGDTPVAYLVDTNLQQIVFYGWPVTNRYTKTNYFWIEQGAGLHVQRIEPVDILAPSNLTFSGTVDFEEDKISMIFHSGVLRDDLYYWVYVRPSTISPTVTKLFDVPLDGYAGGDVSFTVRLTGWSDTTFYPDHLAEIWLNTNKLGEVSFDGKDDASAIFSATGGAVFSNDNQLIIKGILPTGSSNSAFVIDGFDAEYDRFYAPDNGLLLASDGGHARLSADLFSDPVVWDVTDPAVPVRIADASGAIPSGWSWPVGTNTQWAMCERSQIVSAVPQVGGFGAWMLEPTNAVDYLVIAPREFENPAQELADYRQSMGLRTAVVFCEDIFDQFAGGLNLPEAIRDCLSYAHEHWTVAPWMAVLGGWGHYDYLGIHTPKPSYVPILLGSDSLTLVSADGLFADISGDDGVPDLAIGRLPVQDVDEFDDYIAKLKTYEQAGLQAGHQQMLFVADNTDDGDAFAGDFTATNLELAEDVDTRYTASFSTLESNSYNGVRVDIREAFTNGFGIIQYAGHGSATSLAYEDGADIWNQGDIATLDGPPIPLFISLTCRVGRFEAFGSLCLAESMILRPNAGALATFAPSGLSWNGSAKKICAEFYKNHTEREADTLGPTLLRTRQFFGVLSGSFAYSIRSYNLLGDPALKLQGGAGGAPPAWVPSYAQWRWEKFAYHELTNSTVSGSTSDPEGRGWDNFTEYAFGGYPPRLTANPATAETAPVSWNERKLATDLDYSLWVSTNLLAGWELPPSGMVVSNTSLEDGVMERVDAELPFSYDDLFIKLDVIEK